MRRSPERNEEEVKPTWSMTTTNKNVVHAENGQLGRTDISDNLAGHAQPTPQTVTDKNILQLQQILSPSGAVPQQFNTHNSPDASQQFAMAIMSRFAAQNNIP